MIYAIKETGTSDTPEQRVYLLDTALANAGAEAAGSNTPWDVVAYIPPIIRRPIRVAMVQPDLTVTRFGKQYGV